MDSTDEWTDWKNYLFHLLYAAGIFKESSRAQSLRSDEDRSELSSNNNINNEIRKKDVNVYKSVLNFFGLKVMRSEYEEYELVQHCTDSLGTDSTHDNSDHGDVI
jgi:hypothetical protein